MKDFWFVSSVVGLAIAAWMIVWSIVVIGPSSGGLVLTIWGVALVCVYAGLTDQARRYREAG